MNDDLHYLPFNGCSYIILERGDIDVYKFSNPRNLGDTQKTRMV